MLKELYKYVQAEGYTTILEDAPNENDILVLSADTCTLTYALLDKREVDYALDVNVLLRGTLKENINDKAVSILENIYNNINQLDRIGVYNIVSVSNASIVYVGRTKHRSVEYTLNFIIKYNKE